MYTLFIGNKNYSSWSLRGWLAVKLSGAPFREVKVQLTGVFNPDNLAFSPTALVPALHHGEVQVWDTLAIAEYLAERHAGMWPQDPAPRDLVGFGALGGARGIEQHEHVEVAIAHVAHDGRDHAFAVELGARLEQAIGQARDGHARVG